MYKQELLRTDTLVDQPLITPLITHLNPALPWSCMNHLCAMPPHVPENR